MCLPQGYHRKGESVKGSSSKGKASIVLWYVKVSLCLLHSNWAGAPLIISPLLDIRSTLASIPSPGVLRNKKLSQYSPLKTLKMALF